MNDQKRHDLFGRILPTIFVHHIFDLHGTNDFVIGRSLTNAYVLLSFVADDLARKVKRAKGEDVERLARITAEAMKAFNESGTGEAEYIIIPKLMFEILTQTQMVLRSSKQVGKFVRGVILEKCENLGITQDDVDAYLKTISSNDIWYQVKSLRAEYTKSANQRKAKRKAKTEAQRLYRERKLSATIKQAKTAPIQCDPNPTLSPSVKAPEPISDNNMQPSEMDIIINRLLERHPHKSGNQTKIKKALLKALTMISADDLVMKHSRCCDEWVGTEKETRFIPTLAKWLNERGWLDAPTAYHKTEEYHGLDETV